MMPHQQLCQPRDQQGYFPSEAETEKPEASGIFLDHLPDSGNQVTYLPDREQSNGEPVGEVGSEISPHV